MTVARRISGDLRIQFIDLMFEDVDATSVCPRIMQPVLLILEADLYKSDPRHRRCQILQREVPEIR